VKYATKAHNHTRNCATDRQWHKGWASRGSIFPADVWKEFDLVNVTIAAGIQSFVFTTTGKNTASSGFTQA